MVREFREKTKKYFKKIGGYDAEEIEYDVKLLIEEELKDISVIINDVVLYGSRSRGIEKENSDIDILVAYESETVREDFLFNILSELKLDIDGIPVDINPIRKQETGSVEDYLKRAETYMNDKLKHEEEKIMMIIREFKDDTGKILCGEDICEYHASVKAAMAGFCTSDNFISLINRGFEEENTWAVRTPQDVSEVMQREISSEMYDKHVAESHVDDIDVQEFIKKHPDKLLDPLGNYMLSEIAEVYYAIANGVETKDIDYMILNGYDHRNMRVIRKGYENGIGDDIRLYADLKDKELQAALLSGLLQGIDKDYVAMMRNASTSLTAYLVWNGMKKGLTKEDAVFLLDAEKSIINERGKYFDPLNDKKIDTYNDMLTLLTMCLEQGREVAKELAENYVEDIKRHVGVEYTMKDLLNAKRQRQTK